MMKRREFLGLGLGAGAALVTGSRVAADAPGRNVDRPRITIVADADDPIVAAPPVQRALAELERAAARVAPAVSRAIRLEAATSPTFVIHVSSRARGIDNAVIAAVARQAPDTAEGLTIASQRFAGNEGLAVVGTDARGLMYAVLELVDRLKHPLNPGSEWSIATPIIERPANAVRSVMRQFTSETLDTPWLHDREMWPVYLDMLAAHRFNRLHLAFGLGYDTLSGVVDSNLVFAYPFLIDVSGYSVRVTNVTDADRERNLAALQFISDLSVAHGLDFQLGLWMHGYQLTNSPRAKYIVEGLTPDTHAAYCRDALTAVLRACPSISAVGLRIHGESGIAEGSYDFWRAVFDGVPRAGRRIEIDLHAKGLDQTMIGHALDTGMPVNVSPKYWAEHLGMPYHQAAIRDLEIPAAGQTGRGLMTLSEGQRSFTRYGYGDFLRDDRRYTVRHRVFAGTQRLLASGNPTWAAAYARMYAFCGSTGMDLMEPLTCRGRRGTGASDDSRRSGYADARLEPRWDWEKYSYWYRTMGRMSYNPESSPDVCRREFGPGARGDALARALANASTVLPIVTTAHLPSAACDAYWPEVYWNQPLLDPPAPNPYGDTPSPKTFVNVSPLDPQLFSGMGAFADELLSGTVTARYSPVDVAYWLERIGTDIRGDLARVSRPLTVDEERLATDISMQAGLAEFFAARFRSGVLAAIAERTLSMEAMHASIDMYRRARAAWANLSELGHRTYAPALSASDKISNRGAWADRLPAIDADIDRVWAHFSARRTAQGAAPLDTARVPGSIAAAVTPARRENSASNEYAHTPAAGFEPGQLVRVRIRVTRQPRAARLWYRHVNQAERFQSVEMTAERGEFAANIPGEYTDSPFPLQYYFEFLEAQGPGSFYPELNPARPGLPYFVLRQGRR